MPENIDPASERRFTELAEAIADGRPLDWDSIELSTPDGEERLVVAHLRAISQIAELRIASDSVSASSAASRFLSTTGATASPEGTAIGRWGLLQILERVGAGSFGDVYRAWDPTLDREVALKLLRRRANEPDDTLVVEEGRLMARVRHQNVVTIYGAQRIDGQTGLWMEFIRGRTLDAELRERGPFDVADLLRVGIELSRALAAVHAAGLVHRDVKAQNVMREEGGRLVLGDFGTGRELEDLASRERMAGTPAYLAPEIFSGAPATPQSDLYSLGALLFYLATGRHPVPGRSVRELREAHARGSHQSILEARSDLPRPLADVIDRALDPDLARRFKSAEAMESALIGTALPSGPVGAPDRFGALGRLGSRATRSGPVWGVLLMTVIAIGVAAMFGSFDGSNPGVVGANPKASEATKPPASWSGDVAVMSLPGAAVANAVSPPAGAGAAPDDRRALAPILNEHDTVLVGGFENRTGEVLLDDVLEYALAYEIRNSRFVRVASRGRVEDALVLLKKPVDMRLDRELARQVAVRDGELRALVTGRAAKVTGGYVVWSEIINPADGATLFSVEDRVSNHAQLLAAVRRHSFRMRDALGEPSDSVANSRRGAPPSVTPSPRVLRLYLDAEAEISIDSADALLSGRSLLARYAAAEPLLREALRVDPNFQPALLLLAWAIRLQNRPSQDYLPFALRARELVAHTSAGDHFLTMATAHNITADPQLLKVAETEPLSADQRRELRLAMDAYEMTLDYEPEKRLALIGLSRAATSARPPDVLRIRSSAADARPGNYARNAAAAWALLRAGSVTNGRRYATRALRAGYPLTRPLPGRPPTHSVRLFDAYAAWVNGDVQLAVHIADAVADSVERLEGPERGWLEMQLAQLYFALGQLRKAERFVRDPTLHGMILSTRGDVVGLREFLTANLRATPDANIGRVRLLLAAGMVDEADHERQKFPEEFRTGPMSKNLALQPLLADGAIALARGRATEALPLLQKAWADPLLVIGPFENLRAFACEMLAAALEETGESARANEILLAGLKMAPQTLSFDLLLPPFVYESLHLHEQRVRVLRKAGRGAEANAAELPLRRLLVAADEDHLVLVRLKSNDAVRRGAPQPSGMPAAEKGRSTPVSPH